MSNKKDDLPAMPFYVGDWFKATDVQSLSHELKGIWVDMLCYMWESNERGYLKYSTEELSRLLRLPEDLLKQKLEQMLNKGIYSVRESDGAIYSRRMVRDQIIREKRIKSGSLGGRRTFATYFAQANLLANCENEIENKNSNTTKTSSNINTILYRFEELWKRYPNKDGKKGALKHYKATVKTEEDWININKALDNYLQSKTVKEGFIKNGSTWFNNWQDWIDFTGVETEKDIKERKQRELDEAMRKARLNDLTNAK